MQFISHPLIKPESIEARQYQENILNTASKRNTLCVLPTGTGKTTLAILLAVNRLNKLPDSKILIIAPTRPLCAQHQKSFQETLNFPEEDIILLTGKIPPYARQRFYNTAKIISATPQTIENDLKNNVLDLSNFSLLVVDECHRSVKKYAYPLIADFYIKYAKNPLILGITASPGSSKEKINEIKKSLFINAIEIRTETDPDIKPYIKEIEIKWKKVDLPNEIKDIQKDFKNILKEKLNKLKDYNIYIRTKRDLISAQKRLQKQLATNKNPIKYYLISLLAETVKIWYALELLETQSISSLKSYIEKLKIKKDKSSKRVLSNIPIDKINNLEIEHPKVDKLIEIISKEIENKKEIKIIIFSHYRDNIDLIKNSLENIENCNPVILIGQAGERGMSQKKQISMIRDFEDGFYNCLITSPIGEEGLHIPSVDLAIFYEPVPSEIRTIQRKGRVGRTKIGKIIFLITKKTRDEAYHWVSQRRETKMKEILKEMQKKNQPDILDFI